MGRGSPNRYAESPRAKRHVRARLELSYRQGEFGKEGILSYPTLVIDPNAVTTRLIAKGCRERGNIFVI
jgi:hypothetical protein